MRSTLEPNARDRYIEALYAPEAPYLQAAREALAERNLYLSVHPAEGKILQILVRLYAPAHIVEIGTFGGYSALWMAEGLKPGAHITSFERNTEYAALARAHIAASPFAERITVVEGNAHTTLRQFRQPVDMVFIDAEKTGYPEYLAWALEVLPAGGLVVADNTLLFGSVYGEKPEGEAAMWHAMRAFNAALAQKCEAIILPTHEGLSIGLKR